MRVEIIGKLNISEFRGRYNRLIYNDEETLIFLNFDDYREYMELHMCPPAGEYIVYFTLSLFINPLTNKPIIFDVKPNYPTVGTFFGDNITEVYHVFWDADDSIPTDYKKILLDNWFPNRII